MGALTVISEVLKEGNTIVISLVVAMSLYVAARAIWNFINEIQDRKNSYFKGSLEIEGVSEDTKFVVKESLERVAFYRATGISGDAYIINLIANLLRATQGQFSIRGINKAKDYIDVQDGELVILLSRWKTIGCWTSGIIGVASFLLGAAFFMSATFLSLSEELLSSYIQLFFMSLIMFGASVHSVMEVAAYLIARELDDFLSENSECKGKKLTSSPKTTVELEEIVA